MKWLYFFVAFLKVNQTLSNAEPSWLAKTNEEFRDFCDDAAILKILECKRDKESLTLEYEDGDGVGSVLVDLLKLNLDSEADRGKDAAIKFQYNVHKYSKYPDVLPLGRVKVTNDSLDVLNSTELKFTYEEKEIQFIEGFYFITAKDGENYRLVGLNQEWLGCPQPMCFFSMTDAAYTEEGKTYLIRGQYMWELEKPMSSSNAIWFKDKNPNIPLYVDFAFAMDGEMYFARENTLYCQTFSRQRCPKNRQGSYRTEGDFNMAIHGDEFGPNNALAAFEKEETKELYLFYVKQPNVHLRRFVKSNQTVGRLFEDKHINAKNLDLSLVKYSRLSQGVDSAFVKDRFAYLLERNTIHKATLPEFTLDEIPKTGDWSETIEMDKNAYDSDMFACPEDIYKSAPWVLNKYTYSTYFHALYEQELKPEKIRAQLRLIKEGKPARAAFRDPLEKSYLPVVLGILLTAVVVAIVALIVTERRRRIRKKLRIIKLRKRGEVDNRAGALLEVRKHRSHLEDDLLPDNYSPGRKMKQRIVRKGLATASGESMDSGSSSSTGKTPSSIKLVGSRALDTDLTLNSNLGSKIFSRKNKGQGKTPKSSLAVDSTSSTRSQASNSTSTSTK